MHDFASASEAVANAFETHSCSPERSIPQLMGVADVSTPPMTSGFRTVTNTMRHRILPANTARHRTSFMSVPDQWVLTALVIRVLDCRGLAGVADAFSFLAVGAAAGASSTAANASSGLRRAAWA